MVNNLVDKMVTESQKDVTLRQGSEVMVLLLCKSKLFKVSVLLPAGEKHFPDKLMYSKDEGMF
jgi:hypothetical protein